MRRFIFIYLVVVFSFGFVYWVYWYFNPDSFVINEQFNLHPFSSKSVVGNSLNTLTYYQEKADSLRMTNDSIKKTINALIHQTDSIEPLSRKAYAKHEKVLWENVERWKGRQVPDLIKAKLESVAQAIEILKKDERINGVTIAQLKVEKAKIEYEVAKINVVASDFLLKNLAIFQDTSLVKDFRFFDSIYSNNKFYIIPKLELESRGVENEIEQLRYDAIDSYSRRVSFLDFLLFSASNSSTVTYGDITPNDSFVRFILFIQAISCIVLMALFIESLAKRMNV
ncbi:MAG: two pore domain potassium channel family protein [Sphingobacteriales bacterium]|nr:MAG: two pore domain potassium channel family protein [Sphingobacteriales bacterium]